MTTLTRTARHLFQPDRLPTRATERRVAMWGGIVMVALALLGIVTMAPDIKRYIRMKMM